MNCMTLGNKTEELFFKRKLNLLCEIMKTLYIVQGLADILRLK